MANQPRRKNNENSDRSVLRSLMPEPVREGSAGSLKSPHPPKGASGPTSQSGQTNIDTHPALPPGTSLNSAVLPEQPCWEDDGRVPVRGTPSAPVKAYRNLPGVHENSVADEPVRTQGLTWLQYAARRARQGNVRPDHQQASFGASLGRRGGNPAAARLFAGSAQY